MPTILLTNDDGIQSIGLVTLKRRLEKLGNVIVVAPRDERSGIGKALTTNHIKITEIQLNDGSKAYATTGTPADAFFLAANKILKRMPDLLVAGINLGPNLGIDDLLNSGTLGAALEAAIHHVPAIAVSYCMPKMTHLAEKNEVTVEELELTATLAFKVAKHVLENGMPLDVDIVSINVPEKADSKKIEITSLSYKGYGDIYIEWRYPPQTPLFFCFLKGFQNRFAKHILAFDWFFDCLFKRISNVTEKREKRISVVNNRSVIISG